MTDVSRKRSRPNNSSASDLNTKFAQDKVNAATAAEDGQASTNSSRMLRKGMVILKGFLSVQEQSELAANVHRLGGEQLGGFYSCHNEKTKRMRMMNLGLRTDGGKHSQEIPRGWVDTAVRACRLAAGMDSSIPVLRPDICVVNHYTASSRLGWHQDLVSSRDPGLPVVSLSLGQQAIFQYRVSWKKNAAVKSVTLESGDALIFGGRSRGIIHRIPRVGTAVVSPEPGVLGVPDLTAGQLRPGFDVPEAGRYNLNFREL